MQPLLWAWLLIAPVVIAFVDLITTNGGRTVRTAGGPRIGDVHTSRGVDPIEPRYVRPDAPLT